MTHPTTSADERFEAAVEAAKLQALYHFAYGLSHEINNPLANIATRAQTLLIDEPDPGRRQKLATINQQAFRAHEMISDLMLFARPPALQAEEVDLAALADLVVAEMQSLAQEQGTTVVRTGAGSPLIISADPTQLAVALRALVQNSLEAVRSGGRVEVSAECGMRNADPGFQVPSSKFQVEAADDIPPAPHLVLSVWDTGPGIPPELRPHIFDPFYCGREAGRGLGLGLCKTWRIVELHGGTIQVASEPGRGATFTITLPAAR
ncbi:MAG: HAMP domain-containing sensor histidine kinase [Pirellulaceae bacterium]